MNIMLLRSFILMAQLQFVSHFHCTNATAQLSDLLLTDIWGISSFLLLFLFGSISNATMHFYICESWCTQMQEILQGGPEKGLVGLQRVCKSQLPKDARLSARLSAKAVVPVRTLMPFPHTIPNTCCQVIHLVSVMLSHVLLLYIFLIIKMKHFPAFLCEVPIEDFCPDFYWVVCVFLSV